MSSLPARPQTIIPGYENTAIWVLSNLQLLALAHVFAVSRPFRAPQWSNVPFTLVWCAFSSRAPHRPRTGAQEAAQRLIL